MASNTLHDALVDNEAVNFWFTTKDTYDIRRVTAAARSMCNYVSLREDEAHLALMISRRPASSIETNELDQLSTNVFEDLALNNGDIMVIFSSIEAVKVYHSKVDGGILVVAQMPTALLEELAELLGVTFTRTVYGIYGKTFRPGNHSFNILRYRLWHLSGIVLTFGTLYGQTLITGDSSRNRPMIPPQQAIQSNIQGPASPDAVQSLEKTLGPVADDIKENSDIDCCTICSISMLLTVMPCGHRFHTSCVEEWLLARSNSCPLCRKAINSVINIANDARVEDVMQNLTIDNGHDGGGDR